MHLLDCSEFIIFVIIKNIANRILKDLDVLEEEEILELVKGEFANKNPLFLLIYKQIF